VFQKCYQIARNSKGKAKKNEAGPTCIIVG